MRPTRIVSASVLIVVMLSGLTQAALVDGLIAYWDMELRDGTRAKDAVGGLTLNALGNNGSGGGNDGIVGDFITTWAGERGTFPNGTGYTGNIGTALYTDGNITNEMTISHWWALDNVSGPRNTAEIYAFGNVPEYLGTAAWDMNGPRSIATRLKWRNTSSTSNDYFSGANNDGQPGGANWINLITRIKADGTQEVFYANGDRKTDTGSEYTPDAGHLIRLSTTHSNYDIIQNFDNIDVKLGWIEAKPDPWYIGSWWMRFDEVGVWNRALSDTEIQAVYQAGLDGTSLLVPEPSTLVLLGLGGLALVLRTRRRRT